jgi:hypothetical protein
MRRMLGFGSAAKPIPPKKRSGEWRCQKEVARFSSYLDSHVVAEVPVISAGYQVLPRAYESKRVM